MRYVLDADILIGALDGSDAHHQQSRQLFVAWREQDDYLLVSVVNLSDVLVAPAADQKRLRAAREAVAALGVTVHSPTETIGVAASRLRSRHPISLPDGYLLAIAKHRRDRHVLRSKSRASRWSRRHPDEPRRLRALIAAIGSAGGKAPRVRSVGQHAADRLIGFRGASGFR